MKQKYTETKHKKLIVCFVVRGSEKTTLRPVMVISWLGRWVCNLSLVIQEKH